MEVSLWTVLGIVLWLVGVPFAILLYYSPNSTGWLNSGFMPGVTLGAGSAFLIVAGAGWVVNRNRSTPKDEIDLGPP